MDTITASISPIFWDSNAPLSVESSCTAYETLSFISSTLSSSISIAITSAPFSESFLHIALPNWPKPITANFSTMTL